MAVLDAGVYQDWIRAYDRWEQAQRRYEAAAAIGNTALTEYLRGTLENARQEYNAAIKDIRNR